MLRQAWCAVAGLALIMTSGSAALAQQVDATDITARIRDTETHPEHYPPEDWAVLSSYQQSEGDLLRAAFWFYMYQMRSRPWARADDGGSGAAALRASFDATLGLDINEWISADLMLWRSVVDRAIAFEARLPLYAERPSGMDSDAWQALVERERRAYADEARAAFAGMDPAKIARARREKGLPVGPLSNQGRPLADVWR